MTYAFCKLSFKGGGKGGRKLKMETLGQSQFGTLKKSKDVYGKLQPISSLPFTGPCFFFFFLVSITKIGRFEVFFFCL